MPISDTTIFLTDHQSLPNFNHVHVSMSHQQAMALIVDMMKTLMIVHHGDYPSRIGITLSGIVMDENALEHTAKIGITTMVVRT
jgi:hypothetical protein